MLGASSKGADGATCQSSSDCKSGGCTNGTCSGAKCSCSGKCPAEGAPASECASGWVCVYYAPDAVSGFFGASGGNGCAATCGNCPLHWSCTPGGTFCTYDSGWQSPKVTIEGPMTASAGQAVAYHANATSPVGANIVEYDWAFTDTTSGAAVHGPDATHTFMNAGTYTIQVSVKDDGKTNHYQTGDAMLQVTVCALAGQACAGTPNCCGGTCIYDADAGTGNYMVCR